MDWVVFTGAFLGSGLAAVILNSIITAFKDNGQRKRRRRFLASKLAFSFEKFAIDVYHCLEGGNRFLDSGGHEGDGVAFPDYLPVTISDEFLLLSDALREAVFDFPDTLEIKRRLYLRKCEDIEHRYLAEEEAWSCVKDLGAISLEISERIRRENNLPNRVLSLYDGKTIRSELSKG